MAKTALITGSATRIGRELAIHLACSGWDLALHFNSSAIEISALEGELKSRFPNLRFQPFQADLESLDFTSKLIGQVITYFGSLDLLINNASIFEPSNLRETSTDLMVRHHTINYLSPFILIRDFAINSNTGLVINILDTRITNNKSDFLAYSLSKKSLGELTKMAALELAPGFRVNAIALGAVLPPIGKDQAYLEQIALNTPMKIPSGMISIFKSIDYIIDNQDLTGQLICSDGGGHLR